MRSDRCKTRNGASVVICLVGLVVASVILTSLVRVGLKHRIRTRAEHQLEQTYWVLDAAVGMALQRQASDPIESELQIDLSDELEKYSAEVTVQRVESDSKQQAKLKVTARLQRRHELGTVTKRSKTITIPVATQSP